MLNDVACDRVIFLVARRQWSLSSHKRQWSPPTKTPINEGGRKLTEGTGMDGKKAAFDKVFFFWRRVEASEGIAALGVGQHYPAMSLVFVCWHNKLKPKCKSVELGWEVGWCDLGNARKRHVLIRTCLLCSKDFTMFLLLQVKGQWMPTNVSQRSKQRRASKQGREKIGRRMDKSTKAAKIDRRRRASTIPST